MNRIFKIFWLIGMLAPLSAAFAADPTAPVITSPADGATVIVEGQASDPFVPMWTASTDPDGDPLTYTWELWTPGPGFILVSVPTGNATQADLTMGDVAALLAANNIDIGFEVDLVHRAVVNDGTTDVAGPTAAVTLSLTSLEPTPPAITSPADGAAVTVEGQASDPFVPMWSASTDPEGDALEYTWELWTPGPGVLLLSVPTGNATQADLTMGAVAGLLAANGVTIGGSIDLVHRAVVTDGTNVVPGPTAAVNLTLGDLSPTPPAITSPADGAAVTVEGQASDPFVPMWSASTDPEGAAVEYTWELWTPGPTTLLLSVPTGTATQADLTMGAVAGLLAANGVSIGQSIDLVHRAVVTDGTNTVAGATAGVTLTLGDLEPSAPVITSPPDGAAVTVGGMLNDPFVPMWSASVDPEGAALEYTWELWTPGPTTLLLSVPTGAATQADLTMGAVRDLLLANGVGIGDSIDLVHRAVVTDGTNTVEGPTAAVNLTLANFEPSAPVITSPPDGAMVIVEGKPSDPFVPMWSPSVDPEDDALTYTWELWTPGPTTLLLSVPTGAATQADLTMGAVADLLVANGVGIGESIDLVHRAVVTDGTNTVAGPTADVTLQLLSVGYPIPTMGQLGSVILVLLMALAGFAGYRRLHI